MRGPNRRHLSDLRGASRLVVDAATGTADVVEAMHRTIQDTPLPIGRHEPRRARGIPGLVYRAVRGGMRLVGHGIDASLALLVERVPEGEPGETQEALIAALNGVYGDHLAATGNELAVELSLRGPGGRPLTEVTAGDRVVVLAHGLCMGDMQWRRNGHDHGLALAEVLGHTPVYLRYNSGLPVVDNGWAFAAALDAMLESWPVEVRELTLVGFSMGGLVTRSAIEQARVAGLPWGRRVDRLVCLGTPHLGAPLAQGGHWLNEVAELSPYTAPLGRMARRRSAGLHDLRHGAVTGDPNAVTPLPEGVRCFAVAGTRGAAPLADHSLSGDGLVPVRSALGMATEPWRSLRFPEPHTHVVSGARHLDLLDHADVFTRLLAWLEA